MTLDFFAGLFFGGVVLFMIGWLFGRSARKPLGLPMDTDSQLFRWGKLYQNEFGITLGDISVPQRKVGFGRLIVVATGVTPGQVSDALGKHFTTFLWYTDINAALDPKCEQRSSVNGSYAVWARDEVEADEEYENLSANETAAEALSMETLTEHLLHLLVVFKETGSRLNLESTTRCDGSRDLSGKVPSVLWLVEKKELVVRPHAVGTFGRKIRARRVVAS